MKTLYENYDNIVLKCAKNYITVLELMAGAIKNPKSILDIGIGTGNLEQEIFRRFPKADIIGLDNSDKFLAIAKKKNPTLTTKLGDATKVSFGNNKFSHVISSLTIHHFEDEIKEEIFKKIYRSLKPGGILLSFDMFEPENGEITALKNNFFEFMRRNGLSEEFIEQEKLEMAQRDKLVKLSTHKKWLERLGFTFEIIYHNELFAAYIARKRL